MANPTPTTTAINDDAKREAAIRALCAAVFARPDTLVQALTHPIDGPWHIEAHAHRDQLQLDLFEHCAGRLWVDGRWLTLGGITAMASAPGATHGYQLKPDARHGGPGRVYHLRLRVGGALCRSASGLFEPVAGELTGVTALVAAMRVVIRLGAVDGVRPPMLLARLTEVLCLWPGGAGGATGGRATPYAEPSRNERGMSAALDLIDKRLADPPGIEELAQVAHFSSRHFSRRFQAAMGCTPHTYITARRFALARQVLSQDRLTISDVAGQLGFGSVATFSRWFSQHAGVSPSSFREDPSVM